MDNKSIINDNIGDLYRSALMLGKRNEQLSKVFFEKAKKTLGEKVRLNNSLYLEKKRSLYWAEKILDEYMRLKFSAS